MKKKCFPLISRRNAEKKQKLISDDPRYPDESGAGEKRKEELFTAELVKISGY